MNRAVQWCALSGAVLVVAVGVASAAPSSTAAAAATDDPVHSDFNGDGYEDLAIGVPSERVNGYAQAGAVHVLYGGADGVTSTGSQLFTQASSGVAGGPESRDFFGQALAAGDFDGDGFADLAIGVPREDIDGSVDEGMVQVLRGSSTGLVPLRSFSYISLADGSKTRCRCDFGAALAAGDVNHDGVADLAIGTPHLAAGKSLEAVGTGYGGVVVLFGGNDTGLGVLGRAIEKARLFERRLGLALAMGDRDGDGYDDVAAGGKDSFPTRSEDNKGLVKVFSGGETGLVSETTIPGEANADRFGEALVFGDFDGNGREELAIGAPGKQVSGHVDAGSVSVVARNGNRKSFSQVGLDGAAAQPYDKFGLSLAAGDFNADGRDDLAIGAPFENFSGSNNAGIVHVLYGRSVGLTDELAVIFHQNKPGIAGVAETGDVFGLALSARRLGKSGAADLAIGIPGEALGATESAGAVSVLYGDQTNRLTSTGSQLWSQNSTGIAGAPSTNDKFGTSLG